MQHQALPGFRDFHPDALALRSHIFRVWRDTAARYGFEEYDGPPLEPLELYTEKSGTEIVGQLFNFVDKGDRAVSLRPEMTPTFARMVASRVNGMKKPVRWFSVPQLFRYEKQQRGRLREHFQLNCDLAGEAGSLADAEIVGLVIDIMRGFGLGATDVRVRLSDRRLLSGILSALGLDGAAQGLAYALLDKLGRREEGEQRRALVAAGVGEGTIASLVSLREIRTLDDVFQQFPAASGNAEALQATLDGLAASGLADWIDLDLTIVRGLAYYTGTVFEVFDAGKTLRAICGGGRYDGLVQALAGVDLPCVGFGMGDVVLGELLSDRGLLPVPAPAIDVFVASVTPDDVPHVLALTRRLRDGGLRVEHALSASTLAKQLKLADARRARLAIVVGPDDRARGEVILRDLAGKAQSSVALDAAVTRTVELLAQAAPAHAPGGAALPTPT